MSIEATLATWELTKKQVNSREKFLLLSLARRAGEEHTCWPSIKRIVEDTGFDRKTVIETRQSVIDKKLIAYTGRMVGRSGQIPEMKLLYVDKWEQKRNSPRLNDADPEPVDKSCSKALTSTENGMGTSPKNGTGTSTENGTLNSKEEKVIRKKSFCAFSPKKSTSVRSKSEWRKENAKTHDFAESKNNVAQSRKQMEREAKHIEESNAYKKVASGMPDELREKVRRLKC